MKRIGTFSISLFVIFFSSCNYYSRLSNKVDKLKLPNEIFVINHSEHPISYHIDSLCLGDTVNFEVKLYSADKKYKLWGFNAPGSTLSINSSNGNTIPSDTIIEIEKDGLLTLSLNATINEKQNKRDSRGDIARPYGFYVTRGGIDYYSFFESGFYTSSRDYWKYVQLTIKVHNQEYWNLLNRKKDEITLRRSDCRNSNGYYIDFRGGSFIVSLFDNSNLLLKDTLNNSDPRFFMGNLEKQRYKLFVEFYGREDSNKRDVELKIKD